MLQTLHKIRFKFFINLAEHCKEAKRLLVAIEYIEKKFNCVICLQPSFSDEFCMDIAGFSEH